MRKRHTHVFNSVLAPLACVAQLTSYGNVNLVNESLAELEADYTAFHEIVGRGIFKVA